MKKKRNLRDENSRLENLKYARPKFHSEKDGVSCEHFPPWYAQVIQLPEEKHKEAVKNALDRLKRAKPDVMNFIEQNKMELIGIIPNISYAMDNNSEGYLGVTFVHDFSQTTLLYWCKAGFCMAVNASMNFNDGVRGLTY